MVKECDEECGHDINVYHNGDEYYEMCDRCWKTWYYIGKKRQQELKDIWEITD